MDAKSIEAVLDWALYHKRKGIVTDLLPLCLKQSQNFVLEGRIQIFVIREFAETLSYENPDEIKAMLENLVELENNYHSFAKGIKESTWGVYKRELVVQGAMSILYRALNSNGANPLSSLISDEDITVPGDFLPRRFISEIEDYFKSHQVYFFGDHPSESGEEDYNSHLRSFTDIIKAKNRKNQLLKSKVFYLFRNNSWKTRKEEFISFLDKFEASVFPTDPVVSLRYGDSDRASKGGEILHEIAEPDWDEEAYHREGPYKSSTKLPENSFSSPQKSRRSEAQPPQRAQKAADVEQIIRKYNEQDPLPQALGHSESTKLFASRAGTAERQSAALLADRREIAPAQHKNSSSSAGKKRKIQDVGEEPATARQTEERANLVADPISHEHLEYDEPAQSSSSGKKQAVSEDIENISSDESFDPVLEAMGHLKKTGESIKNKKKRLSLPSQLGSPLQQSKKGGTRTKWTIEEQLALEEGMKKHGIGKWREILEDAEFGPPLSNRTNVNLKDRFRVMEKKGWSVNGDSFTHSMN